MKRFFLMMVIALFLVSCEKRLGKFVYIDTQDILHVDNKCEYVTETKKARPILVIPIEELKPMGKGFGSYCSSCFNDKIMDEIQIAIQANKERCLQVRRNWYNSVYGICYYGDYKQFCSDIKNRDFRIDLYNAVKDKYFMSEDINNFDSFSRSLLGFDYDD